MNTPFEAEQIVLGAIMLDANCAGFASEALLVLEAEDFSSSIHRNILEAMRALFKDGETIESINVFYKMQQQKTDTENTLRYLIDLLAGATLNPYYLLEILTSHSTRKRLISLTAEMASKADDSSVEPQSIIDDFKLKIADIENGKIGADHSYEIKDFLELPEGDADEEIIEGVASRSTRFMLVGEEGGGKSVLLRQIAALYTRNIHPFTFKPIEGGTALIIDLENPRSTIKATFQRLMLAKSPYDSQINQERHPLHILEKPMGIDIRSRSAMTEIEAVIRNIRPKLVVIGPLYKMYQVKNGETYELIAQQIQNKLDYLQKKYDFALFIEHHANKKAQGVPRDMSPSGSSYWLRWPEVGMGLTINPDNPNAIDFECWRQPRFPLQFPSRLIRGQVFPFSMASANGYLAHEGRGKG